MHKIDGPGHLNNAFVSEDAAAGRAPTLVTPEWLNSVQEELAAVVEGAGLPLNKNRNQQVNEALAVLARQQKHTAFSTAGVAPNFTLTAAPAIDAYAVGLRLHVKFSVAGNGANTLNVNGLGAKSLMQYTPAGNKTSAVIAANQLVDVEYDGVDFVLLDPLGGGLQYVATPNIAVTTALTAAHAGRLINLQGTPGTATLPAVNSLPAGTAFHLWSQDNAWTVAKQADNFINTGNGSPATLSLSKGESLILIGDGANTWIAAGGSALNAFSNAFAASKASNGYQKLPGGLILQWGRLDGYEYQATAALGQQASWSGSFPIAFPTACLSVTVSGGELAGTNEAVEHSYTCTGFSATGLSINVMRLFGNSAGTTDLFGARYLAIGY